MDSTTGPVPKGLLRWVEKSGERLPRRTIVGTRRTAAHWSCADVTRGAVGAFLVLVACSVDPSELESASKEAKQTAWVKQSQDAIRALLDDPSSAQFRNVHFFQGGGVPVTCGEVTAKSSAGAYDGYQRFVAAGDALAALETRADDFENLWALLCVN